jgi:uncharacterized protein HemX
MSENEGGESKWLGAFLLGFLTGVLVCIGVGGGFFFVVQRRSMMEAEVSAMRAAEAEAMAREQAERARAMEQMARIEAEKAKEALRAAEKKAKEKDKDKEKEKKDR